MNEFKISVSRIECPWTRLERTIAWSALAARVRSCPAFRGESSDFRDAARPDRAGARHSTRVRTSRLFFRPDVVAARGDSGIFLHPGALKKCPARVRRT